MCDYVTTQCTAHNSYISYGIQRGTHPNLSVWYRPIHVVLEQSSVSISAVLCVLYCIVSVAIWLILLATSEDDLESIRAQKSSEMFVLLTKSITTNVMTSEKNKISKMICLNGECLEQLQPRMSECWRILVWSFAIYTRQSGTLLREDQKYFEDFEMRCYARFLKISWTKHKSNE